MSAIFLRTQQPMASLYFMRPSFENIVLGIDPGLQTTGWGVIEAVGSSLTPVACGSIAPDVDSPLGVRLLFIEKGLDKVLKEFRPISAGIEEAFAGASIASAFLLGAARAACLISCARAGVGVEDLAATQIKKAITGSGRADKKQMGYMVKTLLPTCTCQNDHEADAFAIAMTASWRRAELKVAS